MKNLIKTSFIAIVLLLSVGASAQIPSLGIRAGMNLSNFSGKGTDGSDAKIGFSVGATVDLPLTSDWYLLTGLDLSLKGAKNSYNDSEGGVSYKVTNTANPMYLQIPVHIGYKLSVLPGTKIVFRAGPYVAYGIGGKSKTDFKLKDLDTSEKTDFFGDKAAKSFDFGLGFGAGAEFGKLGVGLGYDLGLSNISRSDNLKTKNMNASVTVGYKFF